jgi:tRNA (mo5U34)-methyltransferase
MLQNEEQWNRINEIDRANNCKLQETGWWHSIELGDGRVTPGVRSVTELRQLYASFGLPSDLHGKRVLDIGCWDGFFSYEAERRGAEVVAIDYVNRPNFFAAREALGARVVFHEMSVYEMSRDRLGVFDIVLMLGVLYHLQHPLLALQKVCEVTRDLAIIESHVIDGFVSAPFPIMRYYEADELGQADDNWWGPNVDCLGRMLRTVGYRRSEIVMRENDRVAFKAFRRGELMAEPVPSIEIVGIVNSFSYLPSLPRRGRRASLTVLANNLPAGATRDNLTIDVDGYGTSPVYVGPPGPEGFNCETQINAALPLGLPLGNVAAQVFCQGRSSPAVTIELVEGSDW